MADHLVDVASALVFALRKLKESGGRPSSLIIKEYNSLLESAKASRPQIPEGLWPMRFEEERAAAVSGEADAGSAYAELEARTNQVLVNLRRP